MLVMDLVTTKKQFDFRGRYKRSKLETKKRTVVVLFRNDHLPFLI